jgi:hypothetical protein
MKILCSNLYCIVTNKTNSHVCEYIKLDGVKNVIQSNRTCYDSTEGVYVMQLQFHQAYCVGNFYIITLYIYIVFHIEM